MFEAGIPARRRTKLLPGLESRADLIIGGALFRILQDVMGFADFLETRLGARLFVDVRVKFPGKLTVGALDILRRGIASHPQGLVVVLELHLPAIPGLSKR